MVNIPTDILLEVFQIYVTLGSPRTLLTVCKKFYDVVINSPSLWTHILLCDEYSKTIYLEELKLRRKLPLKELDSKIQCGSIQALVQALKRTKNCTFELTVVLEYEGTIDWQEDDAQFHWELLEGNSWPNRCRALNLVYSKAINILPDCAFPALERLEIMGEDMISNRDIQKFFPRVYQTSRRLYHLHLQGTSLPYNWCNPPPHPGIPKSSDVNYRHYLPCLMRRVQSLHLTCDYYQHMEDATQYATSVTTLGLYHSSAQYTPTMKTSVKCPSQHLQALIIQNFPLALVSVDLYSKIVHLTIDTLSRERVAKIDLPELKRLTVNGWWPLIVQFRAPKLYSLELLGFPPMEYSDLAKLRKMSLRPPKVDVNMDIAEVEMQKLVEALWDEVEDLQIVYSGMNGAFGGTLASAFQAKTKPLCPKLRCLVILSKKSRLAEQNKSEELLKKVVKGRKRSRKIKEVKYGWYEVVKEEDDPRQGNIEWVNITDSSS